MSGEIKAFQRAIEKSGKILVTSHISPDPDAISSTLLLGNTLKVNFPDKKIEMVLEEHPARMLEFLEGYGDIKFEPVLGAAKKLSPDFFILLDAPSFDRSSRHDGDKLRSYLEKQRTKTAIIDHHEQHGKDNTDIYINNRRPATAQEVYELLFENLGLKKPVGFSQTALLGIISDTARHKFDNPVHRDTYRVVSDLLDDGASIEHLESRMGRYDTGQLSVLNHLIGNIKDSGEGYTYSYITDEFAAEWLARGKPLDSFKLGFEEFTNGFLKNFENNDWGFAAYKEIVGADGFYGVSFRALSGTQDVSKIAHRLGGGGHKPAAGAKFKAASINDAIAKIQTAIRSE
ncbi:MAG TPA: DHH family phosphoesterase [Candidatus Saccharimonadales bacterium]|nr:DHH family phosphoesterase [Candidatus Saccharimonadales bacterium]